MSSAEILSRALDGDIAMAHERFVRAMEGRLPNLALESKERYFAVLSALVSKLETGDKSLREVLTEMMAEAAGHLMAEMSASR
jgi:hypothetical protein